jgi:hypothetical protein
MNFTFCFFHLVATGEHYKPVDCDDIVEKQSDFIEYIPLEELDLMCIVIGQQTMRDGQ